MKTIEDSIKRTKDLESLKKTGMINQIKNDPKLRTENGRTLVYPLISIRRGTLNVNPANKARYGVNIPPYFDYYKMNSADYWRDMMMFKTEQIVREFVSPGSSLYAVGKIIKQSLK